MALEEQEHPNPSRWWRHRRYQAYLALFTLIGVGVATMAGWVPEALVPLAQTLCWTLTAVVAVYSLGASAVDALAKLRGAK